MDAFVSKKSCYRSILDILCVRSMIIFQRQETFKNGPMAILLMDKTFNKFPRAIIMLYKSFINGPRAILIMYNAYINVSKPLLYVKLYLVRTDNSTYFVLK